MVRQASDELDSRVVQRLVAQDPTALDEFHRLYRARILGAARQIVGDEWAAEDVLQDVLWSVFRGAPSFRGASAFSTWVFRITQNAARMYLRRNRRLPMPADFSSDAPLGEGVPFHPVTASGPFEDVLASRALEQLDHAVRQLDPTSRELFNALDVKGEDRLRVAARLGMTMSALKSRLHRARRALRLAVEA